MVAACTRGGGPRSNSVVVRGRLARAIRTPPAPPSRWESDVGFEGKGVAVWVLEPSDTSTTGPSGDAFGVMLELVVTDEFNAGRRELVNDLVNVVDVPRRQCRPGLASSVRLVHVQ